MCQLEMQRSLCAIEADVLNSSVIIPGLPRCKWTTPVLFMRIAKNIMLRFWKMRFRINQCNSKMDVLFFQRTYKETLGFSKAEVPILYHIHMPDKLLELLIQHKSKIKFSSRWIAISNPMHNIHGSGSNVSNMDKRLQASSSHTACHNWIHFH